MAHFNAIVTFVKPDLYFCLFLHNVSFSFLRIRELKTKVVYFSYI